MTETTQGQVGQGETVVSLASLMGIDTGASSFDAGPVLGGLGHLGKAVLSGNSLADAMAKGLTQALDIDLGAVIGPAWMTLDSVRAALKATREDDAATAHVPLAAHQIKSTHSPAVTLMVSGFPHIDLAFAVDFVLKIDSAELGIAGGRISHLRSGGLTAQATLKFAGKTLAEKSTPRFDLPGRLHFPAPKAEDAVEAA